MIEVRPGTMKRSKNPIVEIKAYRSDSYATFVKRAAGKLNLRGEKRKFLSLFKLNGARVLDEDIVVKGRHKPWTLGNYLLLMKKSPTAAKMGVGYLACSDSDSNSEKV